VKSLLLVSVVALFCLSSNKVEAHCWIGWKAENSLQEGQRKQLLAYRTRHDLIVREVRTAASSKPSYKPATQGAPAIPPPPVFTDGVGGDGLDPQAFSTLNSCSALFGLITDTFNSATCHVEATVEQGSTTDQLECLTRYPGSPTAVRNFADGIEITTADDPSREAFELMVDKLTAFLGEEFVCDKTTTHEEFAQKYRTFQQAKTQFEKDLENVQEAQK